MKAAFPFAVFFALLGLWTWKLLERNPVPEVVGEEIPTDLRYVVSKLAHAGAYAFFTVLAAWLPLTRRGFRWVVVLLVLHGAASEVLQHVMGWGRTGKFTDVLIDCVGIGLGLLTLRLLASDRR
jgi:VanZ family protein